MVAICWMPEQMVLIGERIGHIITRKRKMETDMDLEINFKTILKDAEHACII